MSSCRGLRQDTRRALELTGSSQKALSRAARLKPLLRPLLLSTSRAAVVQVCCVSLDLRSANSQLDPDIEEQSEEHTILWRNERPAGVQGQRGRRSLPVLAGGFGGSDAQLG